MSAKAVVRCQQQVKIGALRTLDAQGDCIIIIVSNQSLVVWSIDNAFKLHSTIKLTSELDSLHFPTTS